MNNASLIAMDLLLVVPRLAQRAGSFFYMPEAMDNIGKIWNGGSIIADATGQQTVNSTITNTSLAAFAQSTAATMSAASSGAWQEGAEDATLSMIGHVAQAFARLKNFGGVFTYLTSKWALATFVAVSELLGDGTDGLANRNLGAGYRSQPDTVLRQFARAPADPMACATGSICYSHDCLGGANDTCSASDEMSDIAGLRCIALRRSAQASCHRLCRRRWVVIPFELYLAVLAR